MKISIDKAKPNKLFYVIANVTIYRSKDKKCLILKRSDSEIVYPGKWTSVGGKLEHEQFINNKPTIVESDVLVYDEPLYDLAEREAFEESGIRIKPPLNFLESKVIIRPDGIPVVLMQFAAKYATGEVKPEPGAFTDYAWVNAQEIDNYDWIKGVYKEVKDTIKFYGVANE